MKFSQLGRACALAALLCFAASADAYPWMIRHGYTQCASCHVDPSGAGLLTPYGRAQLENLLPAKYAAREPEADEKPALLFGVIHLPDWFNAGASFREALLEVASPAPGVGMLTPLDMVSDLRLEASYANVHAVIAVGFEPVGAQLAALTTLPQDNIVSREHYLAADFADQSVWVRAGRMNLPFGLRNVEHPAWVRSETRTGIDSAQQYGASVAYTGDGWRGEVMGIAGNFLVRQPEYRAHGYSAYGEHAFGESFALGVSSLLTGAEKDLGSSAPNTLRQAHGLFARWAISEPVVLLAEADALLQSSTGTPTQLGEASFLQADWEVIQGLHLMATAENLEEYGFANYGGWGGVAFTFFPHCELRVDGIFREMGSSQGFVPVVTVLAQLHLSL